LDTFLTVQNEEPAPQRGHQGTSPTPAQLSQGVRQLEKADQLHLRHCTGSLPR